MKSLPIKHLFRNSSDCDVQLKSAFNLHIKCILNPPTSITSINVEKLEETEDTCSEMP